MDTRYMAFEAWFQYNRYSLTAVLVSAETEMLTS
jgi:hypothetical protein